MQDLKIKTCKQKKVAQTLNLILFYILNIEENKYIKINDQHHRFQQNTKFSEDGINELCHWQEMDQMEI